MKKTTTRQLFTVATISLCFCGLTSSCYRMPDDDDYSLVPTYNNPAVTNDKNEMLLPNVGY